MGNEGEEEEKRN